MSGNQSSENAMLFWPWSPRTMLFWAWSPGALKPFGTLFSQTSICLLALGKFVLGKWYILISFWFYKYVALLYDFLQFKT